MIVLLLQKLLKSAGKEGKHTVFLLADTQIKEESFLEDVDGLLNAGEVANLFNIEEKTEVLEVRYSRVLCVYVCPCIGICLLYNPCLFTLPLPTHPTHLQAMRPIAQAEDKNADFTPLALFSLFVNRCKENLHVILAMSPIGDAFRNRLRKFPSLINCCTIDWFQVSLEWMYIHYCTVHTVYDTVCMYIKVPIHVGTSIIIC